MAEAAEVGIDIFRIFDALNDVEQMRPAIEAVLETNSTIAEVALCYTGDLNSPKEDIYTLDYPAAGRAHRLSRSAHPGDQGHGGLAAAARRATAGVGVARCV